MILKCDYILFAHADSVVIENGFIIDYGYFKELRRKYPEKRVLEYKKRVFLPPIVNSHTHLELTDILKKDLDFSGYINWIISIIENKRKMDVDFFVQSFKNGLNLIEKTTASYFGNIIGREIYNTFAGNINKEFHFVEAICLNENEIDNVFYEYHKYYKISPHTFFTIHYELMEKFFETNKPLSIHLFESFAEVDYLYFFKGEIIDKLFKFLGIKPVKIDFENFLKNILIKRKFPVQFVHLCYSNETIKKIAKNKNFYFTLCPRSNFMLGNNLNFEFFIENSIDFSLGTDGLCSNNDIEVHNEAIFIYENLKNKYNKNNLAKVLLKSLTINGISSIMVSEKYQYMKKGSYGNFTVIENPEKKIVDYVAIFENLKDLLKEKILQTPV